MDELVVYKLSIPLSKTGTIFNDQVRRCRWANYSKNLITGIFEENNLSEKLILKISVANKINKICVGIIKYKSGIAIIIA